MVIFLIAKQVSPTSGRRPSSLGCVLMPLALLVQMLDLDDQLSVGEMGLKFVQLAGGGVVW